MSTRLTGGVNSPASSARASSSPSRKPPDPEVGPRRGPTCLLSRRPFPFLLSCRPRPAPHLSKEPNSCCFSPGRAPWLGPPADKREGWGSCLRVGMIDYWQGQPQGSPIRTVPAKDLVPSRLHHCTCHQMTSPGAGFWTRGLRARGFRGWVCPPLPTGLPSHCELQAPHPNPHALHIGVRPSLTELLSAFCLPFELNVELFVQQSSSAVTVCCKDCVRDPHWHLYHKQLSRKQSSSSELIARTPVRKMREARASPSPPASLFPEGVSELRLELWWCSE